MLLKSIVAFVLIILQQCLIAFIGLLTIESSTIIGILVFLLCIPMLYINKLTWKYIRKYGIINFQTINAGTSEIDVLKEERWYEK